MQNILQSRLCSLNRRSEKQIIPLDDCFRLQVSFHKLFCYSWRKREKKVSPSPPFGRCRHPDPCRIPSPALSTRNPRSRHFVSGSPVCPESSRPLGHPPSGYITGSCWDYFILHSPHWTDSCCRQEWVTCLHDVLFVFFLADDFWNIHNLWTLRHTVPRRLHDTDNFRSSPRHYTNTLGTTTLGTTTLNTVRSR